MRRGLSLIILPDRTYLCTFIAPAFPLSLSLSPYFSAAHLTILLFQVPYLNYCLNVLAPRITANRIFLLHAYHGLASFLTSRQPVMVELSLVTAVASAIVVAAALCFAQS